MKKAFGIRVDSTIIDDIREISLKTKISVADIGRAALITIISEFADGTKEEFLDWVESAERCILQRKYLEKK